MANGTDIAKAYVQIIPSAEGIKGKLEEIMGDEADSAGKKSGGKFGQAFGNVLKTAGKIGAAAIGAAATGIGALTKSAIEGYAEYEQLAGGAQLMFGEAYDFIAEKASGAFKTVQMSQSEYLQQANGFAVGLKTALGGNEQAAAELADKILTAEADIVAATGNSQEAVQNAFNGIMKSNYTMLDNLQIGITPTKEGMQEVIDKVNEWNAANGKASEYTIDNLADVQSALVDYIEMQGLSGYAANEASETISGSIAGLQASYKNLVTGFGDSNADMEKLFGDLVSSAETVLGNLLPVAEQALGGIADAVGRLAPVIAEKLPGLLEQVLPPLLSAALDLTIALGDALVANLPIIIDAAIQLITALCDRLSNPDTIQKLLIAAWEIIKALGEGLMKAVPALLTAAANVLSALFSALGRALQPALEKGREILIKIGEGFSNAAKAVVSWGRDVVDKIVSGIRGAIQSVVNIGRNIVEGIWNGISGALTWIKNKITGWVGNVMSFIKGLFGISSPSKWAENIIGLNIAKGIGVGFVDGIPAVEKAMRDNMPTLDPIQITGKYGAVGTGYGYGPAYNYGGVTIVIEGRDKDAAQLARELQTELTRRTAGFDPWRATA